MLRTPHARAEVAGWLVGDLVNAHHDITAAIRRKGWSYQSEIGDNGVLTPDFTDLSDYEDWAAHMVDMIDANMTGPRPPGYYSDNPEFDARRRARIEG